MKLCPFWSKCLPIKQHSAPLIYGMPYIPMCHCIVCGKNHCNCMRGFCETVYRIIFSYLTSRIGVADFCGSTHLRAHTHSDANLGDEWTQFSAPTLCHFLNQMHVQCWEALVLNGSEHCVLTWLKSVLFKYVRKEKKKKKNQWQWVQLLCLRGVLSFLWYW